MENKWNLREEVADEYSALEGDGHKSTMDKILDKIEDVADELIIPILIGLLIAAIGFTGFFGVKSYLDMKKLNTKYQDLYVLKNYDTTELKSNTYTKNETADLKQINELIDYNLELQEKADNYIEYLAGIQASYENFLKYILLPSLNIWKDPFLGNIKDDLVGLKYLENNEYNDIDLIDKWSNFIKDVGSNTEYNEIDTIELGDIVEEGEDFYIPIKISYTAKSNRSFLLLVEKLSTTSNQKSISLINELVYNIWEKIKERKGEEIEKLMEEYTGFDENKAIGYNLYQRVKNGKSSKLIDDSIIEDAIKNVAQCSTAESVEYCYYKFRNKYRNLPSLAYKIGFEGNREKTENFRTFLADLPQIIKIVEFTYEDPENGAKDTLLTSNDYKGNVVFRIYGDGISNEEVEEIQDLLGNKCLGKTLTPELALSEIGDKLVNLGNNASIDTYSAINLVQLEKLITTIADDFDSLSNYKKVIKIFEVYRMLSEGSICNM